VDEFVELVEQYWEWRHRDKIDRLLRKWFTNGKFHIKDGPHQSIIRLSLEGLLEQGIAIDNGLRNHYGL